MSYTVEAMISSGIGGTREPIFIPSDRNIVIRVNRKLDAVKWASIPVTPTRGPRDKWGKLK